MTDGDRSRFVQQQERSRLTDDVGATYDYGVLAGDGKIAALEYLDNARRRAGLKAGLTALQSAGIHRVKAVDILIRGDGFEEAFSTDVFWKRKLNEDAVYIFTRVEI